MRALNHGHNMCKRWDFHTCTSWKLLKQPSRDVPRKRCSENMQQFTGEHPCQSVISIKLQNNFFEITLRHGCSPVSLLHIFRIPISKNTSGGLLLTLDFLSEFIEKCVESRSFNKWKKIYVVILIKYRGNIIELKNKHEAIALEIEWRDNFYCKLKFSNHMEDIYKKATKKLNALFRTVHYMDISKRKMNAFFKSQYNYCPLIWMYCNRSLMHKINHERCLRIIYSDWNWYC